MIFISPTQIHKKRDCLRKISFEYVLGIKSPPSPKQQFGLDVHAHLEKWLQEGTYPPDTPEGLVARQGIRNDWLPAPSKNLLVEQKFVLEMSEDIRLIGYIDCVDPEVEIPIVIDHKTTSNLVWAKTQEELQKDPQAIIYSAAVALSLGAPAVTARWVYYSASNPRTGPRKPTGAKPVEIRFCVGSKDFEDGWLEICDDVGTIYNIRSQKIQPQDLPSSPEACDKFGGCFYRDQCSVSGMDVLFAAIEKERKNNG